MSTELERLERLAERLRSVEPALPSPQARIRGLNLALAAVGTPQAARRPRSAGRFLLALAAAGVVLIVGTVAASADALPDSPLYPVKGLVEDARGLLLFSAADRVNYHLELAGTRLREAQAMFGRHRDDLAEQALADLAVEIKDAASDIDSLSASDLQAASQEEQQLEQAIQMHDAQLAGLQGNVTNPQALSAIQAARDRAQQALTQTRSTVNSKGSPSSSGGRGKGTGRPSPSSS
jgi:hypothetical protein